MELFPAILNRLQQLAGFNFTYSSFPTTTATGSISSTTTIKRKQGRRKRKFQHINLPEVQLISLLIIAVKLFYPFDDSLGEGEGEGGVNVDANVKRYPYSWRDPAAQIMDWKAWMGFQKEFSDEGGGGLGNGKAKGKEIGVRAGDVFGMDGRQIDEYLDWYERMWGGRGGKFS